MNAPSGFSYQLDTNSMLNNYRNGYQNLAPQGNMGMNGGSPGLAQTQSQQPFHQQFNRPATGFGGPIQDPNNMTGWQKFAGGTDMDGNQYGGWGMPALGAAQSVVGGYLGFQNMKNAKDTLKFQKNAFSQQFENQRTMVNNDLRDRDRIRQQANPSHQSTTQFV